MIPLSAMTGTQQCEDRLEISGRSREEKGRLPPEKVTFVLPIGGWVGLDGL